MPSSRPRSLRWWLGGLVAAVAVPVLLLLIWISAAQVRREQMEARQMSLNIARATASRMRDLHAESLALLKRLATRPGVAAFDPAACRSVFAAIDFLPRYADVFLFDRTGALVCSGNTLLENQNVSLAATRWLEQQIREGKALREAVPVLRTFEGQQVMMLAIPVHQRGGTIVLLELVDVMQRDALLPGGVITILDQHGTVVARSHASEAWEGRNVRGTSIADLASSSAEGLAQGKGIDGVSRQYGFTHVPELGWTVYAGIPTSTITEPVREMLVNGAIGGIGIVLVVVIMTLALARRIGRPIGALVKASTITDAGAYKRVATVEGPLEIATLIEAFNRMVDLREVADQHMRNSEQKMRALSDRLLTVQEEERTRIARELHDDLGQSLTALKMDVVGLLANAQPSAPAPIRERILRTLDATVSTLQQISSELRPRVLDDLGLVVAIEAEARLMEERSGIECEVSVTGDVPQDRDCITAIYRIVQEALTNVARHANASRVEIRLRGRGEELLLEIRDDGRGVTADQLNDPLSLGLIGIRERATLIGGVVQIEGIADRGTIVSVRIPSPAAQRPLQ